MSLFGLIKRSKPADAEKTIPVMKELPVPAELPEPGAPSSNELRQMLFDAIATGDEARFASLCEKHREFIAEYAPTWMVVPESLRANPVAAEWYERGLKQLTRVCAG